MKQSTYTVVALMAILWICGSINAEARVGLGQALLQIAGGIAFGWAFAHGKLWTAENESKTREQEKEKSQPCRKKETQEAAGRPQIQKRSSMR